MLKNPVVQMIFTALFWSLGGIFVKLVDWNPLCITGFRGLFAMLFLCVVFKRLPSFVSRDKDGKIDKKGTVDLLLGGFFYAATMFAFVVSTKLTTAANSIFLQNTSFIYLIILSPFVLKEKINWVDFVAIFGVILGMIILLGNGFSGGTAFGNFIALLSGLTYALATLFLRKQKNAHPLNSLILANFFAFVFALPFILKSDFPSVKSFTGIVILGVLQIGMASFFWCKAIRKLSAVSCVIIGMLEPILNPVWVAFGIGEIPAWNSILGGLLILAFIIFHVVLKGKKSLEN
ncbi:DMT family transporter [Treponema pectinovorum]|uniref:DMT family transporter n=1 Tax=Treponema pectinovorum TaxID=164 RepID=UPI003D8C0531